MRQSFSVMCLLILLFGTSQSVFALEVHGTGPSPCTLDNDNDDTGMPEGDDRSLTGRLGGSREAIEDLYGEPVNDDLLLEYELEDCGSVFITYYEDEEAIDFTMFSPRDDDDKGFTESDAADWTVMEAEEIVANVLPLDADEGRTLVEDDGLIMVEGFSQTLEEEVSRNAYDYGDNSPTYGGYSYALHLTDTGEVSYLTVQLAIED